MTGDYEEVMEKLRAATEDADSVSSVESDQLKSDYVYDMEEKMANFFSGHEPTNVPSDNDDDDDDDDDDSSKSSSSSNSS
jgi:hypothetical protein